MRRIRTAAVTGTLVLAVVGSAPPAPAVAYPAPAPLAPATAPTLPARYAATQEAVGDALSVARTEADHDRATVLESLVGRDLLEFDARGNGRTVEVIGDLAGADRIAVVVPGSHTTLDTFDRNRGPGGGARALAGEISATDPEARVAVVAWLGYDTPQGINHDSATDRLAHAGAGALRTTVDAIRDVNQTAPISLLCHSYGSVVCAYAVADLAVADLVLYGSPGVGARTVDELGTDARVWAGRAAADPIRFVPPVRMLGIGFGPDPASPGFGARPFPAGDGGHGDYHLRGSEALQSLALIVLGGGEPGHG